MGKTWPCLLAILLGYLATPLLAGPMRIKLKNGNYLKANYCWEESGEIKFEVPGGVVGIPKYEIESIEEIVIERSFSPEIMTQREETTPVNANAKEMKKLKKLISERLPSNYHVLSRDQVEQVLQEYSRSRIRKLKQPKRLYAGSIEQCGEVSEWVRLPRKGISLMLSNIVISPRDLETQKVFINLFDGDGNLMKRMRCQVHRLEVNEKQLKKLGISGDLYVLTALIFPNPRIRRYEISAAQF